MESVSGPSLALAKDWILSLDVLVDADVGGPDFADALQTAFLDANSDSICFVSISGRGVQRF